MSQSGQIPLSFPERPLGFDDLAITDANRAVVSAIRRADQWPYHVFCLVGRHKSGRTTLARAWAEERGGEYLTPDACARLKPQDIEHLSPGSLAVDDADMVSKQAILLNLIGAFERSAGRLLLVASRAPSQWQTQSRDLASRLRSAPMAELSAPDEPLMRARIQRACARAYLNLPKAVEDYLVTRLGLSFEAIEDTVTALNGAAGERALSVPLAREVLAGNTETNDGQDEG